MAQAVDTDKETVTIYLPAGRWVYVWSREEYGSPDGGTHQTVGPPVGEPALFYRECSETGARFEQELEGTGTVAVSQQCLYPPCLYRTGEPTLRH